MNTNNGFKYQNTHDFQAKTQADVCLKEVTEGVFTFEKNRFAGGIIFSSLQDAIEMLNTSQKVAVYKNGVIITNFKLKGVE